MRSAAAAAAAVVGARVVFGKKSGKGGMGLPGLPGLLSLKKLRCDQQLITVWWRCCVCRGREGRGEEGMGLQVLDSSGQVRSPSTVSTEGD